MPFISFSCRLSLARTSVLRRSGKSGHLGSIPDVRGKAFTIEYNVAMGFSYVALLCQSSFLRFFAGGVFLSWKGVVELRQMPFLHQLRWLCGLFIRLMWLVCCTDWFFYVKLFLCPRNKSHLVMVHAIFLVCCWIRLAGVSLRISVSVFIEDTDL